MNCENFQFSEYSLSTDSNYWPFRLGQSQKGIGPDEIVINNVKIKQERSVVRYHTFRVLLERDALIMYFSIYESRGNYKKMEAY